GPRPRPGTGGNARSGRRHRRTRYPEGQGPGGDRSGFSRGDASASGLGGRGQVDLNLGPDRQIDVIRDGIIEAGDPTFSPDCKRLAYYGLDRDGKSDIYVVDLADPQARSRRLTEDLYAERDLS